MFGFNNMAKTLKTLNDIEIAIIKKLVEQGKPSQEIMGIINIKRGKPELHVNFGRISDIKNGKTKRALDIEPATDAELEEFLKEDTENKKKDISEIENISKLFPIKSQNPLILDISETDMLECKESFSKDEKNLLRPLCALANNKGGYILYGVKDKTWEVVGIKEKSKQKFLEWDLQSLDSVVLNYLSCGIEVNKNIVSLYGMEIAVLKVEPARKKPVIYINNVNVGGETFATGDIFFRYPGSSRKICPSELDKIIEERMQSTLKTTLMKQIETIFKNGIENSAVMNIATGEVEGKSGNFVIDEKLLPKIQFLKEGEFVEKKGAPALKLVGDVRTISEITKVEVETNVNIDIKEIVSSFLNNTPPTKPREYIKSLALSSRKWAPLFYFIQSGGNSYKAVVEYLNKLKIEENITYPQKQIDMINQNRLPTFSTKNKERFIEIIENQEDVDMSSAEDCLLFCVGIAQFPKDRINLAYCKKKLKFIMEHYWAHRDVKNILIKISSYLDILFYKKG